MMGASLRETGSREPSQQAVSAASGFDPAREIERLQAKVDAFTNGETFLYLRPEDQDKAAIDLDDESLVKWCRWALACSARFYEEDAKERQRSVMEMTAQHGVVALALLTLRSGSERATFDVKGVTFRGEPKGNWRVVIERVHDRDGRSAGDDLLGSTAKQDQPGPERSAGIANPVSDPLSQDSSK